jgi:Flp pilus assembly protein TadG
LSSEEQRNMSGKMWNFAQRTTTRLVGGTEGTAAIEFAFVAPVLIAAVLALTDVAAIVTGAANMQAAVHAGIQYAADGGADMTVARAQTLQAWTSMPAQGTVTAQSYCLCGATASVCTAPCADGTAPASYVQVSATAPLGGTTFSINKTTTETVRLR